MLSKVIIIPMNNGTRVIPPAAVPTSSPLASAKDASVPIVQLAVAFGTEIFTFHFVLPFKLDSVFPNTV